MQDHEVALGEGALDLALGVGELLLAEGDERLEAVDAVGRAGIVLDVLRPEVGRGRVEVLLVQRLVVELDDRLLVRLGIGMGRRRRGEQRGEDEGEAFHHHLLVPNGPG